MEWVGPRVKVGVGEGKRDLIEENIPRDIHAIIFDIETFVILM